MKDLSTKQQIAVLAVWLLSSIPLFIAWEFQKKIPGIIGELLALIIYLVCFFYVFAIPVIAVFVIRLWPKDLPKEAK